MTRGYCARCAREYLLFRTIPSQELLPMCLRFALLLFVSNGRSVAVRQRHTDRLAVSRRPTFGPVERLYRAYTQTATFAIDNDPGHCREATYAVISAACSPQNRLYRRPVCQDTSRTAMTATRGRASPLLVSRPASAALTIDPRSRAPDTDHHQPSPPSGWQSHDHRRFIVSSGERTLARPAGPWPDD
jgi:hypothetical protein